MSLWRIFQYGPFHYECLPVLSEQCWGRVGVGAYGHICDMGIVGVGVTKVMLKIFIIPAGACLLYNVLSYILYYLIRYICCWVTISNLSYIHLKNA